MGGNCLKYLKRGWNRKVGRETKNFRRGQAGSGSGCLKKEGRGGTATPLRLVSSCPKLPKMIEIKSDKFLYSHFFVVPQKDLPAKKKSCFWILAG